MKPIFTKILSFQNQNLTQLHPIVLKMCNTVEDYIACLDSNIHFTKVHTMADQAINPYPLGKLFKRYENILIPEQGRTMWDLKEASQATMFGFLDSYGVVSGTCNMMRQQYPNEDFPSNQANPDVCQKYKKGRFFHKENVGLDCKNIMGKIQPHGKNQILIGTKERYDLVLDAYEKALFLDTSITDLAPIINKLKTLAHMEDWQGQVLFLAEHMHKFPKTALPPLYTAKKIDLDTLIPEVQTKVIAAKKMLRSISKLAYEQNIAEDNFFGSDVQKIMTELKNHVP